MSQKMNRFAKPLAIFALAILALSVIQPALTAYAKDGDKNDDKKDDNNAANKGNENANNKEEKAKNTTITIEQAKSNATKYLVQKYGRANYTLLENSFEGNYRLQFGNGTAIFNLVVSGNDGRIISVEIQSKEQGKGVNVKGQEKGAGDGKKEEQSQKQEDKGVAQKQGEKNADDAKKEENKGGNAIAQENKNAGKGEQNADEKAAKVDENTPPSIRFNSTQAIAIAIDFLKREVGAGNYTAISVEMDHLKYNIKIKKGLEEFDLTVHSVNGRVIEFQRELKELGFKNQNENENHFKVDIKKEGEKQKLNVEVQKNGASIKLQFQGKENTTKSELELSVLFDRLIEFKDNGAKKGVFDANDTIISTIDLRTLNWNLHRVENKSGNGTITMITITQNATSGSIGEIAFIYHLTPTTRTVTFDNATTATIKIWQVKFDVRMTKYHWERNDTKLALQAKFNAEFEAHVPGQDTVKFKGADGITPFFKWGGNATADSIPILVNATVGNKTITLTYPHFNNKLVHDPFIGYLVSGALPIEVLMPALMTVGAVVLGTGILGANTIRSRRLSTKLRELAQNK